MSLDMAEKRFAKGCLRLVMIDRVHINSFKKIGGAKLLDQTIITYIICDEVAKTLSLKDDIQCRMSTAEVMTFAILSASLYGCNYRVTRLVAKHHHYFKKILSHSQIVRRIHKIPEEAWMMVFMTLQVVLRDKSQNQYVIDSFPVKAYENHKSFRSKIFSDEQYHGYSASKKQYFFGIKVHMVIDSNGVPIEFLFTPGSVSDVKAMRTLHLNLPENSTLLGDRAYTDYSFEDQLLEIENIKLLAKRKSNHKRQHTEEDQCLIRQNRNYIETVFSCITSKIPRHIRATTERGFILKVHFFIIAYMVERFFPLG